MGLAGLPPSVGVVKSVGEKIAYYLYEDTNYNTLIASLGINWMSHLQNCHISTVAMYTRSCNIK
jgi:hypothetical protein